MEYHVFLSYSHQDAEIMSLIRENLQKAGLSVWTDEGIEPGTPFWKDAIEEAIEKSHCLVVILSPNAKKSIWVKRELDYAEMHTKRIFPVLGKGNEKNAIPFSLVGSQYIELKNRAKIGALIATIRGYITPSSKLELSHAPKRELVISLNKALRQGILSTHDLEEIRRNYLEEITTKLTEIAARKGYINYDDILLILPNVDKNQSLLDDLFDSLLAAEIIITPSDAL